MVVLTYKFAICYRFKTHLPAWLDGSCHEAAWLKWVSGRARSHVHGVGIACCVCILLEESHRLQKKIMLHLFGGKNWERTTGPAYWVAPPETIIHSAHPLIAEPSGTSFEI